MAGRHRYAHISSVRMDRVNPQLLGMQRVLSEDSIVAPSSASTQRRVLSGWKRHYSGAMR